jgi:hypothetical protein
MEEILKFHLQTKDPNFIGHDTAARDILNHSSEYSYIYI